MAPITPDSECESRHKTQANLPGSLQRCGRCKTALYCSVDCQKVSWKGHKLLCTIIAGTGNNENSPPSSSSSARDAHNPGFHEMNKLLGLDKNDSLHALPEKELFNQLIDCHRMRLQDGYTFRGDVSAVHVGEDPRGDFQTFLNLAESRAGLLPAGWNRQKRGECEKAAVRPGSWSNIKHAVEKSDIQEHYKDPMMPMKLRILGEKIYGKGFM